MTAIDWRMYQQDNAPPGVYYWTKTYQMSDSETRQWYDVEGKYRAEDRTLADVHQTRIRFARENGCARIIDIEEKEVWREQSCLTDTDAAGEAAKRG